MGGAPKQYWQLGGKTVLAHSYERFCHHPSIDRVLVVIGANQEEMFAEALGDATHITGGPSRRESARCGLEWIASNGGADRVLIHDAARPGVTARVIDDLLLMLDRAPGAVPVVPVVDTLVVGELRQELDRSVATLGETVDRDALMRIQTPQAFNFSAILAAHRDWPEYENATDDAQILRRAGHTIAAIVGDEALGKLTHPNDMALAEPRFAARLISRCAAGFDVHRLEAGEELWLGGIRVPHDKGLSGHSDADVALHAITDAVLGCIGEGDIGTHFPPSEAQWRGAPSWQFLDHARTLVGARGGVIDYVDLTIICEAPKIGPHRNAMRARIAEILQVPAARISLKATTTERLGFTGRGEGIAAQAIATVRLPEDM